MYAAYDCEVGRVVSKRGVDGEVVGCLILLREL